MIYQINRKKFLTKEHLNALIHFKLTSDSLLKIHIIHSKFNFAFYL